MSERTIPGIAYNEDGTALVGSPSPGSNIVILVGTACKGPADPQYFASNELPQLIEMYGPADPYHYKNGNASEPVAELTLTRAAIELFQGGPPPGGVWVKRLVESGAVKAVGNAMLVESFSTVVHPAETDGVTVAIGDDFLTEGTTGEWTGNSVTVGDIVKITAPTEDIGEYKITAFDESGNPDIVTLLGFSASVASTTIEYSIIRAVDDVNIRFTAKYQGMWYNNAKITVQNYITIGDVGDPGLTIVTVKLPHPFVIDTEPTTDNALYSVKRFFDKTIKLEIGTPGSSTLPTCLEVVAALQANLTLASYFDISLVSGSNNQERVKELAETDMLLNADVGGTNWSSDDSTVFGSTALIVQLNDMLGKEGIILVIAGADENMTGYQNAGMAHVKSASLQGQDNERVFITGTDNYSTQDALKAALNATPYPLNEERTIVVSPGYKIANEYYNRQYGIDYVSAKDPNIQDTLSGGYAAARLAGLIALLVPDSSPLFKSIGVSELEHDMTRNTQKIAIKQSIIPLAKSPDNSIVVKRAITSAGESSPFFQLMARMVTDNIRYSFRLIAQGFIGLKNTPRVRSLLQSKLNDRANSFVVREILNAGFTLTVSSVRAEQIIGVVKIYFKYQMVFYMEFLEFNLVLE